MLRLRDPSANRPPAHSLTPLREFVICTSASSTAGFAALPFPLISMHEHLSSCTLVSELWPAVGSNTKPPQLPPPPQTPSVNLTGAAPAAPATNRPGCAAPTTIRLDASTNTSSPGNRR